MCARRQILCSLSLAVLLVLSVRGMVIPDDGQQSTRIDFDTCHELNKGRPEIGCSKTEEASGYSFTIDADEFKANEIINGELRLQKLSRCISVLENRRAGHISLHKINSPYMVAVMF